MSVAPTQRAMACAITNVAVPYDFIWIRHCDPLPQATVPPSAYPTSANSRPPHQSSGGDVKPQHRHSAGRMRVNSWTDHARSVQVAIGEVVFSGNRDRDPSGRSATLMCRLSRTFGHCGTRTAMSRSARSESRRSQTCDSKIFPARLRSVSSAWGQVVQANCSRW